MKEFCFYKNSVSNVQKLSKYISKNLLKYISKIILAVSRRGIFSSKILLSLLDKELPKFDFLINQM